jgi:hypothetical protein
MKCCKKRMAGRLLRAIRPTRGGERRFVNRLGIELGPLAKGPWEPRRGLLGIVDAPRRGPYHAKRSDARVGLAVTRYVVLLYEFLGVRGALDETVVGLEVEHQPVLEARIRDRPADPRGFRLLEGLLDLGILEVVDIEHEPHFIEVSRILMGERHLQQLMQVEKGPAGEIKTRRLLPVGFVPLTGGH